MIDRIIEELEQRYHHKPHRLAHVYGVRDTAFELGKKYDLDLHKLELASLLHDMTKYFTYDEHVAIIKKNFDNSDYILKEFNKEILHSFSARIYAQQKYGIEDPDVLDAIQNHTVGSPNMSIYEKIIFISDYIEPNRTYESCVKVRKIAQDNLDLAVFIAIDDSIKHNEKTKDKVPEIAYQARRYYKTILEER